MKKKYINLLLVSFCAFNLVGCGQKQEEVKTLTLDENLITTTTKEIINNEVDTSDVVNIIEETINVDIENVTIGSSFTLDGVNYEYVVQERDDGARVLITLDEKEIVGVDTDNDSGYSNLQIVRLENDTYLILRGLWPNDWQDTYIYKYDVENKKIGECIYNDYTDIVNIYGVKEGDTTFLEFVTNTKIDIFGSYGGIQTLQVKDKVATPKNVNPKYYEFTYLDEDFYLELKQEVEVYVGDTTNNEKIILPVGTKIHPIATDLDKCMFYGSIIKNEDEVSTSTLITIMYEDNRGENTWELKINGVSENDIFVMVPYAG